MVIGPEDAMAFHDYIYSWYEPIKFITWGIASIVGLIGSLRIYKNWLDGKKQIDLEIFGYIMSATFLLIIPFIIRIMFFYSW